MGHVNHAVYFTYFEQCRLTCWQAQTGHPTPAGRVIVAHAACDYRAAAHFGDELEVRMRVGDIGRSSFVLIYDIVNVATGRTIADGRTVMVSYDYAAGRSVPVSDETRRLLEAVK